MAATIVDDAGVDSYAQQTSLGGFRVHNDCKYKNEIKIKLLSASAISNLEAEARCTGGAFLKSSMLNSSLQSTNKVGRGYLEFFRVSTFYGGGGGEGELLDILELLHCFMSAHRGYKKLRTLHHCPKGVSLGL